MLILDLNQVMYATLLLSIATKSNQRAEVDVPLVRHIALNVIRSLNVKFRRQYGQLVIATDDYNYWRKQVFPYYKASRKKARDESGLDWKAIFNCIDQLKQELQTFFPYKYVQVESCEADDIIATLCANVTSDTLILSGDKDFLQLQSNRLIKQYDPTHSKFLSTSDPKGVLFEHIIKGDRGDGIPNICSPDNCFVVGERQNKVTAKIIDQCKTIDSDVSHPLRRNFDRNKMLIDLTQIPDDLKQKIQTTFDQTPAKDRSMLVEYFSKHKLKKMVENINDF